MLASVMLTDKYGDVADMPPQHRVEPVNTRGLVQGDKQDAHGENTDEED